jgi:hypothetical protein
MIVPGTHSGRPRQNGDALHQAGGGLRERGDYPGMVRRSLYTWATIHPAMTAAALAGVAAIVWKAPWTSGETERRHHWRPPQHPLRDDAMPSH